MGHLEEAIESLQESLAICERLNRTSAVQYNRVCSAAALCDKKCYEDAIKMLEEPLKTEDLLIKTRALLIAANIGRIKGQLTRSWDYLTEGAILAQRLGSKLLEGIAYRLLAQIRIADRREQLPRPSEITPDIETSFTKSMRLLQEVYCDDELALTYLAHGHYLLAATRQNEAYEALLQARALMQACGMTRALEKVQQSIGKIQAVPTALRPGQQRVLLARRGVPRGRPLRPDELVEVIWTVDMPDQREVGKPANKAAERQKLLRQLCEEAAAQGAEPTVGDLAGALGVTARTIDRDIAALRAAGETLITRGSAA